MFPIVIAAYSCKLARARCARKAGAARRSLTRSSLNAAALLFLAIAVLGEAHGGESADATVQSLDAIRAAAEQHIRNKYRSLNSGELLLKAGELDSRLRLAACATALSTFNLNAAAVGTRTTVGVRCPGDGGESQSEALWTVYVPVAVESELDVLVLRTALPRDSHIEAGDVVVAKRRVTGLGNNYVTTLDALQGRHLKRPLAAGIAVTTDMLVRDLAVKRGQQVLLVFAASGLQIQAPGIALSDGGISDRIRARNQTSLKVVEGVVESGNLVRVGM